MSEDRLIDIETKLAYQEDLLEQLNGIVTEQQKQIDQLTEVCQKLVDRMVDMIEDGQGGSKSDAEKPPHY